MPLADGLRVIGQGLLPFATLAAAFLLGTLYQKLTTMGGELEKIAPIVYDTANDVAKIMGHMGIEPSPRTRSKDH